MRRSHVAAALSAAALVLVAGCSDDESAEQPTTDTEQTTDAAEPTDEATEDTTDEATDDAAVGGGEGASCLIGTWDANSDDFLAAFEEGLGGSVDDFGDVNFELQYIFEDGGEARVEANVSMVQEQDMDGSVMEINVDAISQVLVQWELDGANLVIADAQPGESQVTTSITQDGEVIQEPTTEDAEIPGLAEIPTGATAFQCSGDDLVLDADTPNAISLTRAS